MKNHSLVFIWYFHCYKHLHSANCLREFVLQYCKCNMEIKVFLAFSNIQFWWGLNVMAYRSPGIKVSDWRIMKCKMIDRLPSCDKNVTKWKIEALQSSSKMISIHRSSQFEYYTLSFKLQIAKLYEWLYLNTFAFISLLSQYNLWSWIFLNFICFFNRM